jgi:DnaD/phage-associated family protein
MSTTSAPSTPFNGFPAGKVRLTPIPAPFFTDLLPAIDHLGEMKVTLYAIWFLEQLEGNFRLIQRKDFCSDERFMSGLSRDERAAQTLLDDSLERAVLRGTLLKAEITYADGTQDFFFLNSPRGRAAVKALSKREWLPNADTHQPVALNLERPNIFRLYEEHIGPLTPMIADALREAEKTYSPEWIEDAVRIAVENNVRRWRYVEAILRSWQEEGRDDQDQRGTAKDRRRYVEGKYAGFFEH